MPRTVVHPGQSRILLVEGIPGIGKSTLIDALLRRYVAERPPRKLRTLLHLTQAHTYGPLAPAEDAGSLTVEQNLAHLDRVVSLLEWHVRAVTEASVPKFFCVIDTLHLTHCHRPGVVSFAAVADIDRRLAALGAKLLFVHASPESLWERGIWARRGEEFFTGYASRKWGSLEQVHRHFVAEQVAMQAQLAHSRIERRSLDIDPGLSTYVDEAYDFWLRPSAEATAWAGAASAAAPGRP
jgi:hypothetical protein